MLPPSGGQPWPIPKSMSNTSTVPAVSAAKPQVRPPQGFAPRSVTVFALGLSGFLLPIIGLIPSVIALYKARAARFEISRAKGHYRGYGLVRAGTTLASLAVLNTLLLAALAIAAVWVFQNTPNILPSLLGLTGAETAFDPNTMLSILDSQDLNSLLSDPAVIADLEQRLLDAGIDPESLFGTERTPSETPDPQQ